MDTIRLLVADDANRRVLGEWLLEVGELTTTMAGVEPDDGDDLCVVDDAGLRARPAAIARWKADSDVFRPCLLVTERGESALDADDANVVDDVVELPASKAGMQRRLDRLLDERAQSARLDADRSHLREQNERLRRFAGRLAHDLRNPLGIVTGYVEEVRDSGDPEHFDVIEDGLGRIQRLIDETLTLARMGETAVDREPVTLVEAAHRAWRHVDTRDASLAIGADVRFTADESRLEQLLENLFRNCIDHVGGGGFEVRVGALADRHGFYVADDGSGIPEADREQVFEVGYTTSQDGTGFGLRIVQEIADAHGWNVAVGESRDGGTCITVTGVDALDGDEP
jgi:signal transduction histidine kinase